MSKVKVSFSVSIDGFGAAPQQSLENPMGVGGEALAEWVFATRTFQRMNGKDWTFQHGKDGGTTGIDDDFFARRFQNLGAWIFGRNMFGPVRGPWRDNSWKGGWGDTPPFRSPVFVLTHYPRESIYLHLGFGSVANSPARVIAASIGCCKSRMKRRWRLASASANRRARDQAPGQIDQHSPNIDRRRE